MKRLDSDKLILLWELLTPRVQMKRRGEDRVTVTERISNERIKTDIKLLTFSVFQDLSSYPWLSYSCEIHHDVFSHSEVLFLVPMPTLV